MRSKGFVVAVLIVAAGSFVPALDTAKPAAGRGNLASAIEKRFGQAGDLTFPMERSDGYFDGDPIQPQRAFYVLAGLHSRQSFTFSVVVYKTAAQAATTYQRAVEQVHRVGDGHAFSVVRSGRVLYMGWTGPPSSETPALPKQAFLSLVALAGGRV